MKGFPVINWGGFKIGAYFTKTYPKASGADS